MKITELLNKINEADFNLVESLKVSKYIPIMDKKRFVADVIATCTDDIDDFITVDRFKMDIYFDMQMIDLYTDLDVASDYDEMIEQYDALCECGSLAKIIALFQNDYNKMYYVLEAELDTLLVQNSIDAQVVKIANKVNKLIDEVSEKFDGVDFNSMLPEGTDINELVNMLNILK